MDKHKVTAPTGAGKLPGQAQVTVEGTDAGTHVARHIIIAPGARAGWQAGLDLSEGHGPGDHTQVASGHRHRCHRASAIGAEFSSFYRHRLVDVSW